MDESPSLAFDAMMAKADAPLDEMSMSAWHSDLQSYFDKVCEVAKVENKTSPSSSENDDKDKLAWVQGAAEAVKNGKFDLRSPLGQRWAKQKSACEATL